MKTVFSGLMNDVLFFSGCAAVTYGLGQMFAPLFWIFPGGVAILLGYLRSRPE